jgi:hyaluronoglucosaminidase
MYPFELGIIEGFFGDSWPWSTREDYARSLAGMGYQFFVYAPKDDKYLRRQWQQDWPSEQFANLKSFAATCRENRIRFGVGFSPFEAYKDYSSGVRQRLIEKVRMLDRELAPEIFCLLFDDMRGDTPQLAATQLAIVEDVAANIAAQRVVMCPTYYSTDPVLERVFGAMPAGYLEALGTVLDPRIDLFWTGPRVCSTEYPRDHLEAVADRLKRRPFLWDNYPVNDSRLMSSFLHLRAFTNRPDVLRELLAGHAANPMKQPYLSRIPLATLPMSYAQGSRYDPIAAWQVAARSQCGETLGRQIETDLTLFQDVGVGKLTEDQRAYLERTYRPHESHPYAREILGWLNGEYVFDPECLTD